MGIKIPRGAFAAGKKAFEEGDDFTELEIDPGKYKAQLMDAKAQKVGKETKIIISFRVPEVDKKATKGIFYSIQEEYIKFLFKDLALLGVDIDALDEDDLEPLLKKLKKDKPWVMVKVVAKDEFTNLRLVKLLEDEGEDEPEDEDEDEETPKKKKKRPSDDDDDDEDDEDEKPVKKKKKPVDDEDEDEEDDEPPKKKKKKPVDDDDEDDE